jgi:2-polyprenyl-3-methyl-5-hydroxy-6-metoxy-1,4-benzoquinol methylase
MEIYTGKLNEDVVQDPNSTHAKIIRFVGDKKEVLEIGCASGYLTEYLAQHLGCRVTGLEINPDAAQAAAPFCARIIVGDVENEQTLNQIAGGFEVIILGDVLEHLIYPEVTLRRLKHRLKPDGRLVVSVPNVAHWTVRRALLFGRFDYADRGILDRTHLRFYTRTSIRALLVSCGYSITGWGVTLILPGHWRFNWGARLGTVLAARPLPAWFENLFAYQFVMQAKAA